MLIFSDTEATNC